MVKHAAPLAVLEERVQSLTTRTGDFVELLQSLNNKVDKVIALEVKQTELHHDVRATMSAITKLAEDMNGIGQRITVVESTLKSHSTNFRIIAGFVTTMFASVIGLLAWMGDKLYSGIIEAVKAVHGVGIP